LIIAAILLELFAQLREKVCYLLQAHRLSV
jgi:hypothetical protein